MSKYELLPQQLLHEGTVQASNFFEPEPLALQWILRTHEAAYWQRLRNLQLSPGEERRSGFPQSMHLVDREVTIAEGTLQCCLYAIRFGISFNIAGGTHHAFTNRGEGFCLLNDQAIAANYLLDSGLAKKILIVDLDVHQGNGTAQIFQHEPRVFTFSMHGANNYPLQKEKSDLDIGLPDGTTDAVYLHTLASNLENLMEKVVPDFMFFQAGVDILATDKLGKLAVTRSGCLERDRLVLQAAKQARVPLVVCMGGGYSDIREIIEAHANTYRLAQSMFF
jgi:acetoin utilization deacetylase AcuC-like enzyme